jgi:hypothetical protein
VVFFEKNYKQCMISIYIVFTSLEQANARNGEAEEHDYIYFTFGFRHKQQQFFLPWPMVKASALMAKKWW